MSAPQEGRSEGGQELTPGTAELLSKLSETVQALNAVVAALRHLALRPPVELHVEHMEVETLEFRLGDIDVEELQGELNIGITQSLRPAKSGEERPAVARIQRASPQAAQALPPALKRVQLWPPPETEGSDKRMTKAARSAPAAPERTGPPVDLARIGDQLVLLVSLPGVKPSDLRVSLVGDRQLFLEGNVTYRHPLPREGLALNERVYGPFSRTVQLPLPVDPGRVAVSFRDGVLKVDLPIRTTAVRLSWQAKEEMGGGRPG